MASAGLMLREFPVLHKSPVLCKLFLVLKAQRPMKRWLLILGLIVASVGCEGNARVPPYQLIDGVPLLTSRSADNAILLATDFCKQNSINLDNRGMPVMSYDSLDGVGYWFVLYRGLTRTPGDHFMLVITDTTGEIEFVPGE